MYLFNIKKKTHCASLPTIFIFETDVMLLGRAILIVNLAFRAGSSQHGNARRASVAWNCVTAIHLKQEQIITSRLTTLRRTNSYNRSSTINTQIQTPRHGIKKSKNTTI